MKRRIGRLLLKYLSFFLLFLILMGIASMVREELTGSYYQGIATTVFILNAVLFGGILWITVHHVRKFWRNSEPEEQAEQAEQAEV